MYWTIIVYAETIATPVCVLSVCVLAQPFRCPFTRLRGCEERWLQTRNGLMSHIAVFHHYRSSLASDSCCYKFDRIGDEYYLEMCTIWKRKPFEGGSLHPQKAKPKPKENKRVVILPHVYG